MLTGRELSRWPPPDHGKIDEAVAELGDVKSDNKTLRELVALCKDCGSAFPLPPSRPKNGAELMERLNKIQEK